MTATSVARRRVTRGTGNQLVAAEAPSPEFDEAEIRRRVLAAYAQLNDTFVDRKEALICAFVALLTGYNFLFVGPRGTAKTALISCLAMHIQQAKYFTKLLGPFTTLSDLIGSIDLAALQQGVERRHTEGKILDCDFAFFDESMKASDGVLNTMLGVFNDTRDFDGQKLPLWSVGSATNWPEVNRRSDRIAALYDRFHIKVPVNAVTTRDGRLKVLKASREMGRYAPNEGATFTLDELKFAAERVRAVDIDSTFEDVLCSMQERLVKDQIEISDRKFGQWQKAIQAMAWLAGRDYCNMADLSIVPFMAWEDQKHIDPVGVVIRTADREIVQSLIGMVDKARKAYQEANVQGMNPTRAEKVLDLITDTVEKVNIATKRYEFAPSSRKDINAAVQKLKADFDTLYNKFKHVIEGGA